jgi:hypothetical protein
MQTSSDISSASPAVAQPRQVRNAWPMVLAALSFSLALLALLLVIQ